MTVELTNSYLFKNSSIIDWEVILLGERYWGTVGLFLFPKLLRSLLKRRGETGDRHSRCCSFLGVWFFCHTPPFFFLCPIQNIQNSALNHHFWWLASLFQFPDCKTNSFWWVLWRQSVWLWWRKDYFNPNIVNAFLGLLFVANL